MSTSNPLRSIQDFGQSIWQDDLSRTLLLSGELQRLIDEDGIRGVTSNPAIFNKAISANSDYDDDIRTLALQGQSAEQIYERLTVQDVQKAADLFRPLYDRSNGRHGFVSLEVNPHLARDTEGTLSEARHLWKTLNRPNVMIKIPATEEGLVCIRQLISEGLNINVTLLFGLPRSTIDAYRHHGDPALRLTSDMEQAAGTLTELARLDINIDQVTQALEDQGIDKFNKPYDSLIQTIDKARKAALQEPIDRQTISAGGFEKSIRTRIEELHKDRFSERMWNRDVDLWPHDANNRKAITNGLGWLDVPAIMHDRVDELMAFRQEAFEAGLRHVVHVGMGGSSLAPLVFQRFFAADRNGLVLHVLDTTDPSTIGEIEERIPLEKTLFIVASKSGTTAEPLAFGDYFFDRLSKIKPDAAGSHFAAITDPGTPLADLARERGFRRLFLNFEDIGGRYSALSYFGLLPAALMGMDVGEILARAHRMMHACAADRPADQSPGIVMGAALGELARQGRDKVTFIVPQALETLGMWLEQLLAESTGKMGTGLLPVAGEPLGPPSFYGQDRVFVHLQLTCDDREDHDIPGRPYSFGMLRRAQALGDFKALAKHGRRVLRIHLGKDPVDSLARLKSILANDEQERS